MIGLAIAAGSGKFYTQSQLLLRSIESNLEQPYHVTIFLPKEDDLASEQIEFYEDYGDVIIDNYPIEEYKMSAKQAALREAEKKDADVYILLDCDTLVLNPLSGIKEFYDQESDLLLCPEHAGWPYWTTHDAEMEWHKIYSLIGKEFPGYTMQAVFDETSMPPYWNGGVVISKRKIANEWLRLTRQLRQEFGPDLYYAEQLALSLLGNKYGVSQMSIKYNYPSYMYLQCPSGIRVIHYSELWHLARVLNSNLTTKLREIGVYDLNEVPTGLDRLKAIGHGVGVRGFREVVRKRWPKLKQGLITSR